MGNAFGSQVTVKEWLTSQRARQRFHDDAVTWFHDMSSPHTIAKDFVKAHPRFRNVLWFLEIFFLASHLLYADYQALPSYRAGPDSPVPQLQCERGHR